MQIPQINLPRHFQISRHICPLHKLLPRPPIPPISKPIPLALPPCPINPRPLPILPPRVPPRMRDVRGAAWPEPVDPAAGTPAVGPRAAVFGEHGAWEERVCKFDKVVGGRGRGDGRTDALGADFAQEARDVGYLVFVVVGHCSGPA